MAESFQFGFGNPAGYSDWAKYAGLDRTTGGFAAPTAGSQTAAGVEPPATFGEYAKQAVAPITNAFQNYSNAANQLGQGNVMGAVNAAKGLSKPTTTTAAPVSNDYQYEAMIGL